MEKVFGKNYFTESNLILSGTHTHSSPGGFLMDVMLDFPNLGFVRETFDALVTGIVNVSVICITIFFYISQNLKTKETKITN